MSSFDTLPIRLAAPQQGELIQPTQSQQQPPPPPQQQEQQAQETQVDGPGLLSPPIVDTEETPSPPPPTSLPLPPSLPPPAAAIETARPHNAISNVAQWVEATSTQPKDDHQFWMNNHKIVESLLTIHRSAKHLLDFTSSIVNSHEPALGQRPIPVMSNGDVLFMTQLSSDIARSVGGISAARHHGQGSRAAARKRTHREAEDREREQHAGGSVKRLQVQQPQQQQQPHHHRRRSSSVPSKVAVSSRTGAVPRAAAVAFGRELACRKCWRTDTPEWRKGPDGGVLCNVCGLIYAKQRRKMKKSSHGGTHPSQSQTR